MVELAAQTDVEAVVADMGQPPFADAAFDCAVANFVLYHIEDPLTAIAELAGPAFVRTPAVYQTAFRGDAFGSSSRAVNRRARGRKYCVVGDTHPTARRHVSGAGRVSSAEERECRDAKPRRGSR
jgi:hypothetical protein